VCEPWKFVLHSFQLLLLLTLQRSVASVGARRISDHRAPVWVLTAPQHAAPIDVEALSFCYCISELFVKVRQHLRQNFNILCFFLVHILLLVSSCPAACDVWFIRYYAFFDNNYETIKDKQNRIKSTIWLCRKAKGTQGARALNSSWNTLLYHTTRPKHTAATSTLKHWLFNSVHHRLQNFFWLNSAAMPAPSESWVVDSSN